MTLYRITAEGDTLWIEMISESPFEVGGYDPGVDVESGETEDLSFDTTATGRSEVEDRSAGRAAKGLMELSC